MLASFDVFIRYIMVVCVGLSMYNTIFSRYDIYDRRNGRYLVFFERKVQKVLEIIKKLVTLHRND